VRSCFWRPLSRRSRRRGFPRRRASVARSVSAAVSSKTPASPNQGAFHRRRLLVPLAFARPACARPATARLPGSCPPTSAIECDPRARPRTDRTPVREATGWAPSLAGRVSCETCPLRDAPAERPRIRGPARLSLRWTPSARSVETGHGRTGRPQFASTRAPFVANPWGTSWRGLQPGAPVRTRFYEPAGAPGPGQR
jgi:hypothetical protein